MLVGLPPIGTTKGLPTKRLKGVLEATVEISEREGTGYPFVDVLSVPGTRCMCSASREESHFLIHAKVWNGLASVPSGQKWKVG